MIRNFKSFLASSRLAASHLTEKRWGKITIVLGNEAADLDSIVSSLACAYAWHQKTNTSLEEHLIIPVVQIPRKDYVLRTECTYTINHCYPNQELEKSMVFWDDVDLHSIHGNLEVILTDHNKLSIASSWMADHVVGIIDHHVDAYMYKEQCLVREITPVGSATTLVLEEFIKHELFLDQDLLKLILGPILLDTINLGTAGDDSKVTERDKAAAMFLVGKILESSESKFNPDAYFESIRSAKVDIGHLETCDLLRKDYKMWQINGRTLGISSVGMSLNQWINRDGQPHFEDQSFDFSQKMNVDVSIIMTSSEDENGEFHRELVAYFNHENHQDFTWHNQILNELESDTELLLEKMEMSSDRMSFYHQRNVKASRKVVQPVMERILINLQ